MHEHRGLAMTIALVCLGVLAFLPFILPVAIWIVLSVYALVKGIGAGTAEPQAATVLVAIVLLVFLTVLALGGGLALLGRPMAPRKRDRGRSEPFPPDSGF